jgi:site-specific recombinase XerC
VNVRAVQKQLGHGKLETTMQYLQLLDDKVAQAYQAFD